MIEEGGLARAGARGGAVTLAGQGALVAIHATALVLLSRLLSPADFGLMAMATVVTGLSSTFRDLGLFTSAVRARTLTHQQASNLFWANSGLGFVVAGAVAATAPWVASINDAPPLSKLLPVLALGLLLAGFQAQFQVQLIRSRRFASLAGTDILAEALGLAAALAGALSGWGYWALAAQSLTAATTRLLSRVASSRWLPSLPKRGAGTKPLVVSGLHYAVMGVADYASKNVDTFVIGAKWGAATVGLYNRSYQLMSAPISQAIGPLYSVVLPILNEARRQGKSLPAAMLRVQPLVTLPVTAQLTPLVALIHQTFRQHLGGQPPGQCQRLGKRRRLQADQAKKRRHPLAAPPGIDGIQPSSRLSTRLDVDIGLPSQNTSKSKGCGVEMGNLQRRV